MPSVFHICEIVHAHVRLVRVLKNNWYLEQFEDRENKFATMWSFIIFVPEFNKKAKNLVTIVEEELVFFNCVTDLVFVGVHIVRCTYN